MDRPTTKYEHAAQASEFVGSPATASCSQGDRRIQQYEHAAQASEFLDSFAGVLRSYSGLFSSAGRRSDSPVRSNAVPVDQHATANRSQWRGCLDSDAVNQRLGAVIRDLETVLGDLGTVAGDFEAASERLEPARCDLGNGRRLLDCATCHFVRVVQRLEAAREHLDDVNGVWRWRANV